MEMFNTLKSFYQLWQYLKYLNNYDYDGLYRSIGIEAEGDYAIQTKYFNRGRQYVKSFGLLGLSFEKLLGRKLSEPEIKRIVLLAHFAPVYDDLFDRLDTAKDRIVKLIKTPENIKAVNAEEKLFLSFYLPVFRDLKTNDDFIGYFLKLTEAQEQSKQQTNGHLSYDEINQITRDKGGFSSLLLRSLINESMNENERAGLYQLGAMSQYMDDIFDWYDDLSENRTTIANQLTLNELLELYQTNFQALNKMQFTKTFKRLIAILLSPAFVCLDDYQKKQVNTKLLSQTRVICDMEKPINQWNLFLKVAF